MSDSLVEHAGKLRVLAAVCNTGSYAAAGAQLAITTSAVSQAMSKLESLFGSALIVRAGGRTRPTALGGQLLRAIEPALLTLESAFSALHHSATDGVAKVSFGAYESIAMHVLPELLPRLREIEPRLRINVRTARSGQLCTLVRRGELDIALVAETDGLGDLPRVEIARDRLGLFTAPPRTRRRQQTLAALAGLARDTHGHPLYYRRFMANLPPAYRNPVIECDSFETLRYLASKGAAVAVLPERVAMRDAGALREVMAASRRPGHGGEHGLFLVSKRAQLSRLHHVLVSELSTILAR